MLIVAMAGCLSTILPKLGQWRWQNPVPQGNDLCSVWGSGPADIFVVGSSGTIMHYAIR
jgi:hypothetical protein